MRKIYFILGLLILFPFTGNTQNLVDALRFSQSFTGGTARFISMGGAFGALGGDFSALSYNPAGLGVFRSSEFTMSPSLNYNKSSSEFLGTTREDYKYDFSFNQLGFVMVFSPGSGNIKNINLGFGYNHINDFNGTTPIEGFNPTGSLVDYFFYNDYVGGDITGIDPEDLDPFWERLAFDAYVIDTISGTNFEYTSPVPFGVDQKKVINTSGRTSEWVFSIGTNYMHKLYLGATLGVTSVRYDALISHSEDWDDGALNYFTFNQELFTRGTGYSFKVGAIFKPIELIRIGGAFHLPTFYRFEDETYNTMESSYVTGLVIPTDIDGYAIDPDIVTYKMETPFKAIGSVGIQLKKMGLISLEYEFIDYSTMRFRTDQSGGNYDVENEMISETYKAASNLRAGAEFRLGTFALRGGYAYYGSPYLSGTDNEDSDYTVLSGGFGIREKNFFFDLGYSHTVHGERHFLYELEQDGAYLKSGNNRIVATLGFKF